MSQPGPSADELMAQLRSRSNELKDSRCERFPHLICNEVQGLVFEHWCEPCQVRNIAMFFQEMDKKKG